MEDYDAVAKDDYQRRRFMKLNKEDLAEVARRAINERDTLRAQVAELVKAGERILEYGDVYRYRQGEESPYEQLKAAIAAAERKEGK